MNNHRTQLPRDLPWERRRLAGEFLHAAQHLAGETPALVRLKWCWDRAVRVRSLAVTNREVSNRNCVAATRGGEQRNENGQSVTPSVQADGQRELDSVGGGGRACE